MTDQAVDTARNYYDSSDADNFYFHIWGGEDIHIGTYKSEDESIFDASRRTVERMAEKCKNLGPDAHVLDIGAGYGGAARYLAKTYGCKVTCLNLSAVENDRNRTMNAEQGVDDKIEVVTGNFEELPFEDNSFDVVWSQDAILHSGKREQVVKEVARVLKQGGEFVFTDPMMDDDCPPNVLQPIFDRIHLESLGSPGRYRQAAKVAGMEEVEFDEMTDQLPLHYFRVLKETERREDDLEGKVSKDYIEKMKTGLNHWVEGGKNGHLAWGIFHFKNQ